jgi:uncharacterized protein (TIGR02145 family)
MDANISERSRGICPAGFHVPSDCEYMYLEHGQGMSIANQIIDGWRADGDFIQGSPGNKLRSEGTGQNNLSGFSGLLPGYRNLNGSFIADAASGVWWTSSKTSATLARHRNLYTSRSGVSRGSIAKEHGFSVRCLKD